MAPSDTVPEISPEELVRRVEEGEALDVLDVRAPFRLASGTIDIVAPAAFHNIAGSQLLGLEDPDEAGLQRAKELAVVCARGVASRDVAAFLNEKGYRASSVRGGMAGWMRMCVARDLDPGPDLDALVQFDRIGKGALGYLLVSDKEAVVIDPPRDPQPFLDRAARIGAVVVAVADTHAHADYISGGTELARALSVPYFLHPADLVLPYDGRRGSIPVEPIQEGEKITFGRATLRVEHTPGHTEGSVTYRVGDDLAFTGDFIFVRSIGRPDLGGKAVQWIAQLWQSLERARSEWPESIRLVPAHYTSDEERCADRSIVASFGAVRKANEPLRITSSFAFSSWVEARTQQPPEAYARIKAINLGLLEVDAEEADVLEIGRNQCSAG